ncbi:MAG: hypothetical protein NW224_18470 [Leptolyngbyaceae cyanobacterium bins.302]|nr:hypothetical protein [Leptolyngbyaceae cyanobacterium bins.302]
MPKFQNMDVWRQAEALMQPAFIRLVANIGKRLDESSWKGQYEDVLVWNEGVEEATKVQVMELRRELEALATDASADSTARLTEIEQALVSLPAPYPGYQLCLSQGTHKVCVDLWEICYQICFQDYDSESGTSWQKGFGQPSSQSVRVDSNLFDAMGEVDWDQLDAKTRKLVDHIFARLPK